MNRNNFHEAVKWSLLVALLVACWCGALAVRKARAASQLPVPAAVAATMSYDDKQSDAELLPVWVIVVFEVRTGKLVGITEFVFPTYDACLSGADEVKQKLELQIVPACYLRWLQPLPGKPA